MWACIFLVRTWQIFCYQHYLDLLNIFIFAFSAPPFSVGETLHIAYKKYKIKRKFTFFSGKYQIYFISWVENIRIFTRAAHLWKFWCFQHTQWKIFGNHLKKVNILYILRMKPDWVQVLISWLLMKPADLNQHCSSNNWYKYTETKKLCPLDVYVCQFQMYERMSLKFSHYQLWSFRKVFHLRDIHLIISWAADKATNTSTLKIKSHNINSFVSIIIRNRLSTFKHHWANSLVRCYVC